MLETTHISVIIPALNEAESLPGLLAAIPRYVDEVIVVDNGSEDDTAKIARDFGATVLLEPQRGYGRACLTGIAHMDPSSDIVVFLDADFCDDPALVHELCYPIIEGGQDFVLASRMHRDARAHLTLPQRFGNQLASFLMNVIWGSSYTDLGPFRAISRAALHQIGMKDEDFGWTVEMQIKAQRHGLSILEVDMPYRDRLFGHSKVSGTISGVYHAGTKILYVIARSYLNQLRETQLHETQFLKTRRKRAIDKQPRTGAHFRTQGTPLTVSKSSDGKSKIPDVSGYRF